MTVVDQCGSCGATLSPEATWCGQCYAPRGAAAAPAVTTVVPAASPGAPAGEFSIMSGVRQQAASQGALPMIKTRWRKTPTTFGPVGRVLWTLFLVLPFPVFVVIAIFTGGFDAGGAVVWGLIVMPLGLKSVWKAGQLPAG